MTNSGKLLIMSTLTSKNLRLSQTNDEDKIICLYKIGLALNPGEVLSWTKKVRGLTSTRHKNIILRVAHGDIYSNDRLHRFRLRDSSACANCGEAVETIQHRITACPLAQETWTIANEARSAIGISILNDFTIENLLGAQDRLDKISLTINAEIIHRLTSKGEGYCSRQLVKSSLKLIRHSEHLTLEQRDKFDLYLSNK